MKLKKLLASILCVAMVLSTISFTVFAEATLYEVTDDTELADAIKTAVDGDTIKLAEGTYTGGISVEKNITLEGAVDEDGAPVTILSGDNGTGYYNGSICMNEGTIKNIKIINAWKGIVTGGKGSLTIDNVTIVEAGYGIHIAEAKNAEDTVLIQNSKIDITWANSFAGGSYAVVMKNNILTAENPYYGEEYGANLVNTFAPNTTIEDNIFGENAKILIRDEAKDGVKIGPNYYADGFENALSSSCADGVKIETYYADREMTEVVIAPAGTITPGYATVPNVVGSTSIWGEGTANANESFVVELYAGDERIAQASLKDYEDIIDGDVYVTWSIPYDGEDSEYWDVEWFGNNPVVDTVPTKVVLYADGVKVAENDVRMNSADDLNPIEWNEIEAVSAAVKIGNKGYSTIQAALEAVKNMPGDVVIDLYDDVELSYGAREAYGANDTDSITINGNGHELTLNQTDSDWSSIGMANADGVFKMNDVKVVKTGYGVPTGAWNTHAINFNVNVEFTNVDFDNSIKVGGATATLTNVNVVEDEAYYGIWIPADAQNVKIDGGSITATNGGRGIKIADEYVAVPAKVNLNVTGMTFETAKKAAVLVSSKAGATITASGNDITKVAADSVNFAWVDEGWENYASEVTVNGEPVVVESEVATTISVSFDKVSEGLYNIVLTGHNGDIYEFVGAEFTFDNDSLTDGNEHMNYEILGIAGKTNAEKSIEKADTYALRLVDGAERMSGKEFVIGQVKFYGQGDINFTVSEGKVVTTEYGTNLGQYYTVDADDTTDDTLVVNSITNGAVEEVTRDVVVNVAYNHSLVGKYWDNDMITVTVKDGFGNVYGPFDVADGIETINDVKLGRLTVTLEAPGFRKYTYNTTLEAGADENDALVLNFWNEVKRDTVQSPLAEIETGKGKIAHNFLVGDIVMDYTVDEYDLAAVTSYYGTYDIDTAEAEKYIKYDLNRDGNIDIIDVHYVLHTLNN